MTEINGIVECLNRIEVAKMKDFVEQFEGRLKRSQVRYLIEKLVKSNKKDFFISYNHKDEDAAWN